MKMLPNFIYLAVLGLRRDTQHMRDLIPPPRIQAWSPALGAWSLSHWTTKEVSVSKFYTKLSDLFKLFLF